MDERFIMHRYQSTRLATLVGVVLMGAWTNWELFVNHVLRWDLLIILAAIATVKVGAMLYLRLTH